MLKKIFTCGAVTAMATSTAFAEHQQRRVPVRKVVQVPFVGQRVPAKGLTIEYDLQSKNNGEANMQRFTCIVQDFFKGQLSFERHGAENVGTTSNSNGAMNRNHQFYFTTKGSTWQKAQGHDNLHQFQVDPKGYIFVKTIPRPGRNYPRVTCMYLPESSS